MIRFLSEDLDTKFNINPKLQKNGLQLYKSFISKEKLQNLISEIIPLFNKPIINSKYESIWTGSRLKAGKKILKTLSNIHSLIFISYKDINNH